MLISFTEIEKALASLERSLAQPLNEFTRDSSIQRFEYTFELTWKLGKKVLAQKGLTALNPKDVIRELGAQGWIRSVETWLEFLEQRNLTSHTYNEATADRVFASAKAFATECRVLIGSLKPHAAP